MKEKLFLIIVGVCVVVCAFCLFLPKQQSRSPIEKYNFENCRIGVLNYEATDVLEYLSDDQHEEFISILLSAQLSEKATPAIEIETSGDLGAFRIELKNGDTLLLYEKGDYLVFNDKAYECYNDVGGQLWRYIEDVYKRHYPVNKTEK